MLEFLQTGKAIYVLAAVCFLGMLSKLLARNLYKRLIRETGNMMMTKNKWLKDLRQRAEDSFRVNHGMANTKVFVEKQIYEARIGIFSLEGFSSFSNQMTALCFLLGGAAAFLSYWYRCDSYYIVLYSSVGILAGLFNIMVDYGTRLEEKRQRLSACIQDYLENHLWKRLIRDKLPEVEAEAAPETRQAAATREKPRPLRGRKREMQQAVAVEEVIHPVEEAQPAAGEKLAGDTLGHLRKSLEQAAVGRSVAPEAAVKEDLSAGESWMKDLRPEEIKILGEIIKEYLS